MSAVRRAAAAALALLGGGLVTARADTASGFAQWQYSAGVLLDQYSDGGPAEWSYALGAGAQSAPRYDGAAGQRLEAYPLGEIRYRDVAYASVSEGIGVNVLHRERQRAGLALNWDFGRRSSRIGSTRGVDPIRSGPIADAYFEQVLTPVVVRADLRHSLIRDEGYKAELGAYVPVPLSDAVYVFAGPSVALGDRRAEAVMFGVSADDARRSGFPVYRAKAGFESVRVGANVVWLVDAHWLVEGLVTWTHLLGTAAGSPLTQRVNSAAFGLALGYTF